MGEYGNFDVNSWSPRFVSTHRDECLRILRSINSTTMQLIREKNYPDALKGLKTISIGLIKIENENLGDFGKEQVLLIMLMPAVAISGILDTDAPENRRREVALEYALGIANNPNHELAVCYPLIKDIVQSYISDLKSGAPLAQIKRKYNYPEDILDAMESLNQDLSTHSRAPSPSAHSAPQKAGWVVLVLIAIIGVVIFCAGSNIVGGLSTSSGDVRQTNPPAVETQEAGVLYQDGGFIFPNSDSELIEQWEAENLSDSDLTYAINEIYARHGYIFKSAELREYYEQLSWYTGEIPASEFSVDCFNQIEQQNWNLLVKERNSRRASG